MEFFEFVFKSFWHFLGFLLISGVALQLVRYIFDFFVELIHGKPIIQNVSIPIDKVEEVKDLSKEESKAKENNKGHGFDQKLKMNIGKVEVISRKEDGNKKESGK